jgi:hypothetical protein
MNGTDKRSLASDKLAFVLTTMNNALVMSQADLTAISQPPINAGFWNWKY